MTATMDHRRSDHERGDSGPLSGRQESLCLSEFVDEFLQSDVDLLDQADDFMNLLPFGGASDAGGNINANFSPFDGEDIELVFELLGDSGSSPEAAESVVDIESVDSSEDLSMPGGSLIDGDTVKNDSQPESRSKTGCARTIGVKPHHYGETKLRLRASAEAASHRKRSLIAATAVSDSDSTSNIFEQQTDLAESAVSPLLSSPAKSSGGPDFLQTSFSSAEKKKIRKSKKSRSSTRSGRSKSLQKRRSRRILDTPPSSPARWNGAHAPPPLQEKSSPSNKMSNINATNSSGCPPSGPNCTSNTSNNENSNSTAGARENLRKNRSGSPQDSAITTSALSECNNNTGSVATAKTTSSTCSSIESSASQSSSKLRFDGTLVSSSRDVKPKQKVIPLSLVEKLKAAAQKATARQSILLPVPTAKAAGSATVALDHDYCFQRNGGQVNSDNLEPEPMDVVESEDEEHSVPRIEVLPDLSLAKRSLEQPVEVVVRQTNSRSLLKVNQPVQLVAVQKQLSGGAGGVGAAAVAAEQSEQTVMMMMGGRDWSTTTFSPGAGVVEQMLGFVEEEEVVITTTTDVVFSDSGAESLDRRRESHDRDDDVDLDDEEMEDGREGRRWKDERGRSGVNRSKQREAGSSNGRSNGGTEGSGTDNFPGYRSRRRRSGSATSNSSFASSSDSGRSRSGSSDCRCSCRNRSRQSSHNEKRYSDRPSRKRSASRERACNRCRYPSPDYTVGSHASRRRAMEAMERDAYTAAGWVNTKEECGKPVAKRERKNIWCMDAETSPAEAAPSARRPPQTPTAMQEALEKIRRGGDRKIIYVGKVPEGTTRVQIREWFSRFGPIAEVSLHFRDTGENYGFITFERAEDAYRAVERGNDDPELPMFQLCFGGRRQFCGQQWSDLDSQPEKDYLRVGLEDSVRKNDESDDFDSLLKSLKSAPLSGARRSN